MLERSKTIARTMLSGAAIAAIRARALLWEAPCEEHPGRLVVSLWGGKATLQAEGGDLQVTLEGVEPRQIGREHAECCGGADGDEESDERARAREHRCLRQGLHRYRAARSAERVEHGHVLLAPQSPREQERRDVRAGDQEQQRYGAEYEPQRPAALPDDHVLQGP